MEPKDVLAFWFADGMQGRWFRSTPELDEQIYTRFRPLWRQAAHGELDHWSQNAEGALALVIVLDQFPLNMFRGKPECFASETKAVQTTLDAIAAGLDQNLEDDHKTFLYMPLMHSEDLAHQETSVRLFEAAGLEASARFARHHRDRPDALVRADAMARGTAASRPCSSPPGRLHRVPRGTAGLRRRE